ncbi:MAG: hypothetical protein ACYDIE_14110, partial [Candidatus Krumholzibacteriia bacterium]
AVPVAAPVAPLPVPPPQPVTTPPATYFSSAMDSLTVLVPYRARSEIEQEYASAAGEQKLAEQQEERGKQLAAMAETRIKMKELEIDGLKAQIDLAKQEQNGPRQRELEARRKVAEMEKSLLERRRDLRRREIDLSRALKDFHDANGKTQQIELDLSSLREQRAALVLRPGSVAAQDEYYRLESELRATEAKALRARVELAGRRKDVADREVGVARMRLQVFDSQNKLAKES